MFGRHALAREAVLSAAAAGLVAAILAWFGPPGSDYAAHAYQRTLFLDHGFTVWNNFWYAGRYSFVTYSLIYYPLAGVFGIRMLAVATISLAALAFAVVLGREWGPASRWSSRTFAVVWAGIVLSAAFPFALGFALALLALWALQAGRHWRFAALTVLTLAASPLAFLLLAIVLTAVALANRVSLRANAVPAGTVAVAATAEGLLWRVFPDGGRYLFSLPEAAAAVGFCVAGLLLTWRVKSARLLRFVFAVYLVAVVAAYLVPSELGENVARLRYAALPLVVLVFSLRRWRPLPIGIAAVALAVAWNVSPLVASYLHGEADLTARRSAWPAAIAFLHASLEPGYRVEAVDTTGHWPGTYLADSGIPLARGWFRQDDFPVNAVLYERPTAATYLAWLRSLGVEYVVLADAPPDYSSRIEAKLVANPRGPLVPVFRSGLVMIYAVPHPQPIVTGPGRPRLLTLTEEGLRLLVSRAGTYRIAVRWSPYWRASDGCLSKGRDGMLRLQTRSARLVRLAFRIDTGHVLDTLAGEEPECTLPREPVRGSPRPAGGESPLPS